MLVAPQIHSVVTIGHSEFYLFLLSVLTIVARVPKVLVAARIQQSALKVSARNEEAIIGRQSQAFWPWITLIIGRTSDSRDQLLQDLN
jgi:hypothetical protein